MSASDDLQALAQKYDISAWREDIPDLERRHPEDYAQVLKDYEAQYERRSAPTFSAGGVGGDADVNHDGVADDGWSRGGGGQWSRSGGGGGGMGGGMARPGSLASLLAPTGGGPMDMRSVNGAPGTSMPRTGNPLLDALLQNAFVGQPAPVSTTMPVGGGPQLSSLLRY